MQSSVCYHEKPNLLFELKGMSDKMQCKELNTKAKLAGNGGTYVGNKKKSRNENFVLHTISVSQFSHQVLVKNSFEKKIYVS